MLWKSLEAWKPPCISDKIATPISTLVVINLRGISKTEVMAWVMECYGNVVDSIPCGIFFSELNQSVQVVEIECSGENHGLHS